MSKKNYTVKDEGLWNKLIQTFVIVSGNEYQNIKSEIEKNEKFQIQLTEKALAQYNQMQRLEEL